MPWHSGINSQWCALWGRGEGEGEAEGEGEGRRAGEKAFDLEHLPVFMAYIVLPWLILNYQRDITEGGVGKRHTVAHHTDTRDVNKLRNVVSCNN